jgi:hypothetical protein
MHILPRLRLTFLASLVRNLVADSQAVLYPTRLTY